MRFFGLSGLLVICAAPSRAGNLLAGEHRASGIGVGRLALKEAAVATALAWDEFRELRLVDLACVALVAERHSGRIGFGYLGCVGERLAGQSERRRNADARNQKRTTG